MKTELLHANFGWLHAPPFPPACCHCLIIRSEAGLMLVDTGIGMQDIKAPEERVGREAMQSAGFQFIESVTALAQIQQLGYSAADVTDIILTHGDPDHVGGLADFPEARVHLAIEEKQQLETDDPRYRKAQFSHRPQWVTYDINDADWFGMPSRCVDTAVNIDVRLIPLPGHTSGHCGVAVQTEDRWFLHVGDAYYLRGELTDAQHPIGELAAFRATDNAQRLTSLARLKTCIARHGDAFEYCGYHDTSELPASVPSFEEIR